ncbi:MAG TPA: hypothetical protein PKK23_06580 [Nitrospirales bacterium]|nr:hypothetical protein [Nitrospirales bacterium]
MSGLASAARTVVRSAQLAQLKSLLRACGTIHHAGGAKTPERLEAAVKAYLQKAYALEQKAFASLGKLRAQPLPLVEQRTLAEVEAFHEKLSQHLDLIERRVLKSERAPMPRKTFRSLNRIQNGSAKVKLRPLLTGTQDSAYDGPM